MSKNLKQQIAEIHSEFINSLPSEKLRTAMQNSEPEDAGSKKLPDPYTDHLTRLIMFPMIKQQINKLLEACQRYNLDFSLASIDLDNFREINERYGHHTGDQLLRNFSKFLLSKIRNSDIVTRSGGEEFIIIFPYTNAENASRALNSFREEFTGRTQFVNQQEFKISFSAGIASINNYQDLESLLAAADQALYSAKNNGRNCIELAD